MGKSERKDEKDAGLEKIYPSDESTGTHVLNIIQVDELPPWAIIHRSPTMTYTERHAQEKRKARRERQKRPIIEGRVSRPDKAQVVVAESQPEKREESAPNMSGDVYITATQVRTEYGMDPDYLERFPSLMETKIETPEGTRYPLSGVLNVKLFWDLEHK